MDCLEVAFLVAVVVTVGCIVFMKICEHKGIKFSGDDFS